MRSRCGWRCERYGADGIAELHDLLCERARQLHAAIVAHPAFEAVHEPESNIVCFRFSGEGNGADVLDEVNRRLRESYNRGGQGWITLTVLEGRPVLRVTVMNPRTTPRHLDRLLDGLAAEGARLLAPLSA